MRPTSAEAPRAAPPWRAIVRRTGGAGAAALLIWAGGTTLGHWVAPAGEETARAAARARAAADRVLVAMEGGARDALALPSPAETDAGRLFVALADVRQRHTDRAAGVTDLSGIGLSLVAADGRPLAWSGRATRRPAALASPARPVWRVTEAPSGVEVTRLACRGPWVAGACPMVVAEWWLPYADGGTGARVIDLGGQRVTLVEPDTSGLAMTPVVVAAPDGTPLLSATIAPRDVMLQSRRWSLAVRSAALVTLALGWLLAFGPLRRWRRVCPSALRLAPPLATAGVCTAAWLSLWMASPAEWWPHDALTGVRYASAGLPLIRSPFDAALASALALALAWTLADEVATRVRRRRRLVTGAVRAVLGGAVAMLAAHASAWVVRDAVVSSTFDLRQFSLLVWNPARVLLQAGLLGGVVALTLAGAAALRGRRPWRRPAPAHGLMWIAPALVAWTIDRQWAALILAVVAACAAGLAHRVTGAAGRRAMGRQVAVAAGLLAAVTAAVYLELFRTSTTAAHDQVATRLAAEVLNQREAVKARLLQAMDDVDALAGLDALVGGATTGGATTDGAEADRAFAVWQATALAAPVSSSLELADAAGRRLSRFAFNLPLETAGASPADDSGCDWSISEEVLPFFGEDRRVWRAARAVCRGDGTASGFITIQATVDRSDLPFLAPVRPYAELQRRPGHLPARDMLGHDVEYTVYGWSGRPLYASRPAGWALGPEALAAAAASRTPFWTRLTRGQDPYDILVFSDRGAIHALGLPVASWLTHATGVAEALVLCGAVIALLGLFVAMVRWRPVSARRLWRAAAASYYRRLLVALVAAAVVPVVGLALLFRASVAAQTRASLEQEAVRTASAAERAIADLAPTRDGTVDDDLLVWVSRLVGADVNVYEGAQLLATSGRTLFASGLLPPRPPEGVYRDVVLGLRAESVSESRLGGVRYLTVGVPMGGSRAARIVTVPLALRQESAEAEMAMLDRRVLLVALFFVLAGGALGYSLAERMADPVRRLARATRRISRGDLDVAVLVRSSDEFRNLAEEFNAMAVELGRQRRQLERTNRLEAWSEVARQVAHDIKNPLTPIQLNAEHLKRVHADRGGPMGAVVDACVDTILEQVRLLRSIASEFSNFASTPTVQREPVPVRALIDALVDPYREALADTVTFVRTVPEGLPDVHVDRALTARALANLVENALQAIGQRGAVTIAATGETAEDGRTGVAVEIADSGPGMDAAALA
ncbi:MAG: HAMP domain-containing protein, partial [Vicinamibacterales bacterium]